MLKVVMGCETHEGQRINILLLGLSHENLDNLRARRPITVSETEMSDLDMPGIEVIICADETEEKILAEIEKRFTITNRVTPQ